jgi:hypothetical protein
MHKPKGKIFIIFLVGSWLSLGLHADPRPLHSPGLVPKVRRLNPRRSLLTLADWFLKNRRYHRAWEIVAFGLAHHPRNHAFLVRAARLNWRFQDLATARIYTLKALEVRPEDSEMRALLKRIHKKIPDDTSASSHPGDEKHPAKLEHKHPKTPPAGETSPDAAHMDLDAKLHLLSLMRLVSSAMTAYNLRHPKKPLEAMDLDKLRSEGLIPKDFQHPELEHISWAGESCTHTLAGAQSDLQNKIGDYRKHLGEIEDWIAESHPHEALRDLEALQKEHGSTRRIQALEQKIWRSIDPKKALAKALAHQAETPGLCLQRGLELWKDGAIEEAKTAFHKIPRKWPDSPHAAVASHLAKLANRSFSFDFLDTFYAQRTRSLAASQKTTAPQSKAGTQTEKMHE